MLCLLLIYDDTKKEVFTLYSLFYVYYTFQVALARHFRAPIRMPENVVVDVVIVTKREGGLVHRVIAEQLTAEYDDLGLKCERDAFDTLFDHAPDKLQVLIY